MDYDVEHIMNFARSIEGATDDRPFHDDTVVLRHRDSRKWFGILMTVRGKCVGRPERETIRILSLKCDPVWSGLLRAQFESVIPAYHMNKEHWNTLILDGKLPIEEAERLILHSFELTSRTSRSGKRP